MNRFCLMIFCLLTATLALGQGFDPQVQLQQAQARAAAVRAARIDALRQLGEAIKGVRLTSRTTIKDFVTETDEINAQFEAFLQGAQQEGKPNIYDDGTVEIKMVMYIDDVAGGLKNIAQNSQNVSPGQIDSMAQKYRGRKFEAMGTGVMAVTPSPASGVDLWQYVSVQGKLMAKRAAQVDAYRNMGETLYGVQLASKTSVKDFVVQNDAIIASFNGLVQGVQFEPDVLYLPDGLVQITATLNVDNLIKFLASMSPYAKKQLNPQAFDNLRRQFPNGVIMTTGVGAPPARFITSVPKYPSSTSKPEYNRIPEKYTPKDTLASKDPKAQKYPFEDNSNTQTQTQTSNSNTQSQTSTSNTQSQTQTNNSNTQTQTQTQASNTQTGTETTTPVVPKVPQIPVPPSPPTLSIDPLARPALPPMPRVPERFVPEWAKRYITVTGNGAYPDNMDVGQARAMARRAAQVDAYRLLSENALGVKLHSETTVKEFISQKDLISVRVKDTFLRGGQAVDERDFRNERYFEVDMKLYLGDMWEIIDAHYNKGLIEEYGKNLESCLPPAERYRSEFSNYKVKLDDYHSKVEAYRQQLDQYFSENRSKLAMDFPIARECQGKCDSYRNQITGYQNKHGQYRGDLEKYQREWEAYLAQYKQYQEQYKKLYGIYDTEADAALMPAPPMPPAIVFSIPSLGELPPLPKVPQRFVPEWANKYIDAKGTGAYGKNMPDAQAMAMARRAAQVDAYRLLVENAMGVRLSSETTVKDFVADKDVISTRVKEAYLRGAQATKEQDYPGDRYFEVWMKLFLGDMWEVIESEYNKVLIEKYGKKLEEYQPDQVRYKNEMEIYQAQLSDYEKKSIAYYQELSDYYAQQSKSLSSGHPVAKRYQGMYDKYRIQAQQFKEQYPKYRQAMEKYREAMERRQAEYEKYQSQYKKVYEGYKNESDIALVPPPPIPPTLSCAIPTVGEMPPIPKVPERFVPDWADKYVTAKGMGVYAPNMEVGQAMAMARRAAQVDAYRLLVENAMGVHLTSETKVQDFVAQNDTMTARVKDSFLRGAQTVDDKDIRDRRYYEVTMKLYLGDMWEIIDAEYNKVLIEKYGKKLEEFQPDQLRFKSEMEVYKAQLRTYKERYQAYQTQLQEYYTKYGSKIALDYPLAKKNQADYQKFLEQSKGYASQHDKYQKDMEKYQSEMERRQAEYDKYQNQFKQNYNDYKNQADIAMIPAPPTPPEMAFVAIPESGQISLPQAPQRFVPEWANKYINADGIGAYPKDKPEAQARAMARRAAQVDAYRVLAESAKGVHLRSETSVKDFLTQNDTLSARVEESFLRGAQEVGGKDAPEDRCYRITMKLYLGDMWEVIDAQYNKVLMEKYGKQLSDFQPDQTRFKTEMEMYQSQLQTYKSKAEVYQKQLADYYAQYGSKLSLNYPVAKKYQDEYRKNLSKVQECYKHSQKYQQDIERYQDEQRRKIGEFEKCQSEYRNQYDQYQREAEIALIPSPPTPPALSFSGPTLGQNAIPQPPDRFIPEWAKKYVTATGTGVYPKDKLPAQAKILAQRAAQVDAYRLLVENALGVRLASQTSVQNFITQKDKITAKVNDAFLRGAQLVEVRHFSEKNYCEVEMKLYLGDMWEIIDAAYNKALMKDYGKKLEEFQPDQSRYRTEMELYQGQLNTYQNMAQAYRKQLEDYYATYGSKLSMDYPVCKKLYAEYQKCLKQVQLFDEQYRQHRQNVDDYQREKQKQSTDYEQFKQQYQKQYENYEREAVDNE